MGAREGSGAADDCVGWSGSWSDRLVARNLLPDDNAIGVIQGMSFSADGNILCCPTNPATFILYDTSSIHTMAPPPTYDALEHFPALPRILTIPATGSAIYATRSVHAFLEPHSHPRFSPVCMMLATGSDDGVIRFYEPRVP